MATETRYSRHEGLFGAEGQRRIRETPVAIVGLGGLGAHVAQQLAYLGTQRYALIDGDATTDSSLNRLVGAVPGDVGTPKVVVAKRLIESIQPDAKVAPIEDDLNLEMHEALLSRAGVVFGCLDQDVPRLQLTDYCSGRGIPYINLASDITPTGEYGGRVIFARGEGCTSCLGELDQKDLARGQMSPEQRKADDRIYGINRGALDETGPSVVSINGVIASLGVTEFMVWLTGLRDPKVCMSYHAELGVLRLRSDTSTRSEECYYCAAWRRSSS